MPGDRQSTGADPGAGPRILPFDPDGANGVVLVLNKPRPALPLLTSDPVRHAYHLALLGRPYSEFTAWAGAVDAQQQLRAVTAVFFLREPPLLLAAGEPTGVEEILSVLPLPEGLVLWALDPEHVSALKSKLQRCEERRMLRMQLARGALRPRGEAPVERLGPEDAPQIAELFRHARHFAIDPHQLAAGGYFGVRHGRSIVSVAAVHFASRQYRVAVVGSVITHPHWRRRGLAFACLSRAVNRWLPEVEHVCLSVEERQVEARSLYEAIGFREHSRFIEGTGKLFRESGKSLPAAAALR